MAGYLDLLQGFDPLGQVQAGEKYVDRLYDTQAQRQAGRQYAAGDRQGAAGTLAQRGDIGSAMKIEDQQADVQKSQREQQAAEGKQKGEFFVRATDALLQIPDEAKRAEARMSLLPVFQSMNMPEEVIQQIMSAPVDDASLQAFRRAAGAELEKFQTYNTTAGVVGGRGADLKLLYDAPEKAPRAPTGYRWTDDTYSNVEPMEGYQQGVAELADKRAAATARHRAPPRGRSGGGGGGASRGAVTGLPSGFVLD